MLINGISESMLRSDLISGINKRLLLLFVLLILIPGIAYSQTIIKVFQTQQSAQVLVPLIAPLFSGQAKIIANNNSLIVRASQPVINEIALLLQELDKPLRNLLIEVSSSDNSSNSRQHNSLNGRIKIGDDAIISSRSQKTARSGMNSGMTIYYAKDGSIIKTTYNKKSRSYNNPQSYRVRTLEGQWAFIQTGQKIPYYNSTITPSIKSKNYYPYQKNSVEFVDVTSGFEVLPVLNRQSVTLNVRPKNQSLNKRYPGQINTSYLDTTITGQLDQWIFLGDITNTNNTQTQGITYKNKGRSENNSGYLIRVSIID